MARQIINTGTTANDGTGDSLRISFTKVNQNFAEVYTSIGSAFSGNYNDLTNKPTLFSGNYNDLTGKPTLFSGNYNDLTNKPTNISSFTNDSGYITASISANLLPSVDSAYDLGSPTNQWGSLYVSANTIFVGGTPISVDSGGNLIVDGSPVAGGSTGDITFDGIKIQGAGTASGDGNGYSTIELVPDADLYNNDQYLIIDPTEPQHIHIRAGGTQDASTAELYLGGESNFVRVIDSSGVRLQNRTRSDDLFTYSDPTDFNTATWFESSGNFFVQFTAVNAEMGTVVFTIGDDDENNAVVTYDDGATATVTPAGSISNLGGGTYRFSVNEAPPASPTSLTGIDFEIWRTRTNSVNLQNNDFTVSVTDDLRIEAADGFRLINSSTTDPILIITNDGATSRTWAFNPNATLTFPDTTVQTTAYTADYLDLSNTPSLLSEFTNDTGFITANSLPINVSDLNNDAGFITANSLPTNVSDLNNDAGYLTAVPSSISVDTLSVNDGVQEKFQPLADATGTVTHDCSSGQIFYHTSPDANWTVNLTNLNLASTYATSVTLIIIQGDPAYYPNALQIAGSAQTINWQGGSAPTPTTSGIDVVTFSIINNSGTYTVLGQLTDFNTVS